MLRKISGIYLWTAPFLAVPVGQMRDLVGAEALIAGYAVFVALTGAAVWMIGAAKTKED